MANLYNDEEGKVDVDIDLTLEEWGRIALIAHKHNKTINDTLELIIQEVVEKLKAEEDAASQ